MDKIVFNYGLLSDLITPNSIFGIGIGKGSDIVSARKFLEKKFCYPEIHEIPSGKSFYILAEVCGLNIKILFNESCGSNEILCIDVVAEGFAPEEDANVYLKMVYEQIVSRYEHTLAFNNSEGSYLITSNDKMLTFYVEQDDKNLDLYGFEMSLVVSDTYSKRTITEKDLEKFYVRNPKQEIKAEEKKDEKELPKPKEDKFTIWKCIAVVAIIVFGTLFYFHIKNERYIHMNGNCLLDKWEHKVIQCDFDR